MIPDLLSELRNPTDIYTSSVFLITVSFTLGFTPYTLEGGAGARRLKYRKFGLLNTLFHITVFIVCYFLSFVNNESIVAMFFQNDISKFSDLLQKVVGFIGIPMLFWTSYWNRVSFLKTYRLLFVIDEVFLDLCGEMFNYKRALRCSYISVITITMMNGVFFSYNTWLFVKNDQMPSLVSFVVFFQPAWFLCFMVFSFSLTVSRIRYRCHTMNEVSLQNLCIFTMERTI